MAKTLILPKLGVNMTDGVITKWLVKEGDEVKAGQVILEAETDKSVQEITATDGGRITKIAAAAGQKVLCQEVIAYLDGAEAGGVPSGVKPVETAAAQNRSVPVPATAPAQRRNYNISPLAKSLCKANGIDPADIKLPAGRIRIVKDDVSAYLGGGQTAAGSGKPDDINDVIRRLAREVSASLPVKPGKSEDGGAARGAVSVPADGGVVVHCHAGSNVTFNIGKA